jgi:hypothetical protein
MRIGILGTLATLLMGAGLALADPGTCKVCGTVTSQPTSSCGIPGICCLPAPTLFRVEVAPPKWMEGKPQPPVHLMGRAPPPVEFLHGAPPPVQLLNGAPPPLECLHGAPPQVQLFRCQPEPPKDAPPIRLPSVTFFHQPPPPCPCYTSPWCSPATGSGGP